MAQLFIPIKIISESNNRDHWTKKRKRAKTIEMAIRSLYNTSEIRNIKPPVAITLVRVSSRSLDYDNLVTAFKSVRDVIADILIPGLARGQADKDESLIRFDYRQEKSKEKKFGFKIEAKELNK